MNTFKTHYNPDLLIHPGETLNDTLESLKMSQADLSVRTGLTPKTINEIINGKSPITPETAIKLEKVLTVPASFWNNLQKNHDERVQRAFALETIQTEISIAKKLTCYAELAKLGYVNETMIWEEKVNNLLLFFRLSSLQFIPKIHPVAFKKCNTKKIINEDNLAAWLRCGEIETEKKHLPTFNRNYLKKIINEFKQLTYNPQKFTETLKQKCFDCGIAISFVPYFKNTHVNGAVRWINDNPLIQLNTRGACSDIFWFTFFHELGHILLHGKKDEFVELIGDKTSQDQKENEANEFASNTLINKQEYIAFIQRGGFSIPSIKAFADNVGVHHSIVLGRMAREGSYGINYATISKYRPRLEFSQ